MLCKRIIPTMLCRGRTLVKGKSFAGDRSIGHVMQAAQVYAKRGVDELCILDISATKEGRGPDLEMVKELSEGCFIPITVGGGIRSCQDIDRLLRAGADKVAICTGAFEIDDLVPDAAARFGRQAIVVVVEHERREATYRNGGMRLILHNDDGPVPMSPVTVAEWMEKKGAGEIFLQSKDRDGTLEGYDLDLIREVSAAVSIPVVASGGAGTYEHLLEGIKAGADGVAAGAMWQYTDATPRAAAQFLRRNGLCARL